MAQHIMTMVFLVPILVIFAGMLATYLNYRKRREMFALYHQERMAAIEKGIELPPLPDDSFREERKPSRRSSHGTLLVGLILLFIGLTLYLSLYFTGTRTEEGGNGAPFALIPAGIGVAFLIYYFTVGRKLAAAMEEERKAWLAEASRGGNPPK
jgi:heme/copper-type cytochrome/quinol oxidase subunit 3